MHIHYPISDLYKLWEITQNFSVETEKKHSGKKVKMLIGVFLSQAKENFDLLHDRHMEDFMKELDAEEWKQCTVPVRYLHIYIYI